MFEVEEGEVVLIHSDGKKIRADELTARIPRTGSMSIICSSTSLEPMAKSVVAMTE